MQPPYAIGHTEPCLSPGTLHRGNLLRDLLLQVVSAPVLILVPVPIRRNEGLELHVEAVEACGLRRGVHALLALLCAEMALDFRAGRFGHDVGGEDVWSRSSVVRRVEDGSGSQGRLI